MCVCVCELVCVCVCVGVILWLVPYRPKKAKEAASTDGWRARAIADYIPVADDEIELREDDPIAVENKCDDGWWTGTNLRTKMRGLLPCTFVEVKGAMQVKTSTHSLKGAAAAAAEVSAPPSLPAAPACGPITVTQEYVRCE